MPGQSTSKKTVYIIAGPNGAGKTTFALKLLQSLEDCQEFLNTDLIARGLSPINPDGEGTQVAAGRIFFERMDAFTKEERSFAFETTLAALTFLRRIKQWKKDGWTIVLYYLYLPSVDFSRKRVRKRVVDDKGHDVPDADIVRRFSKSLANLFNYLPECDTTICLDGSLPAPEAIFLCNNGKIKVFKDQIYQQMRSYLNDD